MIARTEQIAQAILNGDRYFVRPARGTRRLRLAVKLYNAGTEYRWRLRAAAGTLAVSLLVAAGIGYATSSWYVLVALSVMALAPVSTAWAVSGDNLEYLLGVEDDIVRWPESPIKSVDIVLDQLAEQAVYGSQAALVAVSNREEIRATAARNRAALVIGDHGTNLAAEEAFSQLRATLQRTLAKAKDENAQALAIEDEHARTKVAIEAEHRAELAAMRSAALNADVRNLVAVLEP